MIYRWSAISVEWVNAEDVCLRAVAFFHSSVAGMASPHTNFGDSLFNNVQQPTDGTQAVSHLTSGSQVQSQTFGSQSSPPTTEPSAKTSRWSFKNVRLGSKRSVLKASPFDEDRQRWVDLEREHLSRRTNIPPDFLKAFNRIIQQREVCDKIISDAKISNQRTSEHSWNYSIGGGAYSYFASQAKDGSWSGSLSQGEGDDVSTKVKKADRTVFEGSLGLAEELACQLAIDGQVLSVVLFSPVNKEPVHAGTFAYSFCFRLLPISEVGRYRKDLYNSVD